MMNQTVALRNPGNVLPERFSASLLIAIGVAAIFLPGIAGISISILFGSLVMLAAFVYGYMAYGALGTGTFLWRHRPAQHS